MLWRQAACIPSRSRMTHAQGHAQGCATGLLCLIAASWCASSAVSSQSHQQLHARGRENWALPADAFAQGQLALENRHKPLLRHGGTKSLQQSTRELLNPPKRSILADTRSGILLYQPTGFQINGADLTKSFRDAHSNHSLSGFKLSPGTYHVNAKVEDGYHIHLPCTFNRTTPFEIDFSDVFLYFTDHRFGGTWLDRCSNTDFHGPYEQTWTADELDFTQGTILALDNTSTPNMATVQVDDGYPSDRILLEEALGVITFLSDSRLVKNQPCPDLPTPGGLEHRRKLSNKVYQFEYGPGCNGAPGDLFVARGDKGANALQVESCNHTTIRDVTIYSAGCFAIFQIDGSNNTFMGMHVKPYPKPLGNDGKLPLLSSNADVFHAARAHRGTVLKDSYFINSGDDAIALHGEYYIVAQIDSSQHSMVIAAGGDFGFYENDTLTFYGSDTVCKGSSTVVSLRSVSQPDSTDGRTIPVLSDMKPYSYDDCDFMEVKLSSWPETFDAIEVDDLAASPSANGNGFAILNNIVGNLRGRAMVIKSSEGIIAGNIMFNIMNFALEMAPEWAWVEADFVRNVVVMDNVINTNSSGIWLGVDPSHWKMPPVSTNNYAVDFVRNTVVNVHQSPLIVTSAAQVTIHNTTFVNALCYDNNTQHFDWSAPGSVVALANVVNVSISGTQIYNNELCQSPSANYDLPLSMVNATNVQGVHPAASILQKSELT